MNSPDRPEESTTPQGAPTDPLQPAGDPESPLARSPEGRLRSVPLSYGLWCLSFVGLCGIHRLYNRKLPTGLLWLFTLGLCGIGQLVDLLLIPAMVKDGNSKLAAASPLSASPETVSPPPLDLLRERRQQLELQPFSGLLVLRPVLIRRGLLIGGLILGATLALSAVLVVAHQFLKSREAELAHYEQEATELRESMAIKVTAVKELRRANEQLVKRLSEVRSSSALLADLQLRVPDGVQLTKVQMLSPSEMRVEGLARDPVAFGRVNAMELALRRSPLFQATGVTIEKAEREVGRELQVKLKAAPNQQAQSVKLKLPSSVRFALKASLAPLPPNRLVAVMESLQAEGMARRLELLQREGLLK